MLSNEVGGGWGGGGVLMALVWRAQVRLAHQGRKNGGFDPLDELFQWFS